MDILKIGGQSFSSDDLVVWLKLSGRFSLAIEEFAKEKLAARAARDSGLKPAEADVQQRSEECRRALGLHRASETNQFLDEAGATLDDFETYLEDNLLAETIRARVQADDAIDTYFQLNSPKFDAVEVSHMVIEGEAQANEIASLLHDGDDDFVDLAREYSVADSGPQGGSLGTVYRGQLAPELEARIFNAAVGEPLGPFAAGVGAGDDPCYELFVVNSATPAELTATTRTAIQKLLLDEWLETQAQALQVQV